MASVFDSIWRMRSRVTPNSLAHLFERAGLTVVEAEPQPHHRLLAVVQLVERLDHGVTQHLARRHLGRGLGLLVLDEVGQVRVVLLADRRVERERDPARCA